MFLSGIYNRTDMLLAIDIGNTTIGFAVMDNAGHIVSVAIIDTDAKMNKIKAVVAKILRGHAITKAIICSVVPKASKTLEDILKKSIPVEIVGRDIFVPIKNCYKNPKQVGHDRLVGAYGAMKIYGRPLIVVDLGTAITFDVVSAKGEYLGGAIVPGIRLSAESLFLKTALLPHIEIKAPKSIIGKTTQESILSGLFYGYGSLCKGMIDMLSSKLSSPNNKNMSSSNKKDMSFPRTRESIRVVMTGGYTHLMKKFVSPKIRIIDEDLVFKGIYFLSCL